MIKHHQKSRGKKFRNDNKKKRKPREEQKTTAKKFTENREIENPKIFYKTTLLEQNRIEKNVTELLTTQHKIH